MEEPAESRSGHGLPRKCTSQLLKEKAKREEHILTLQTAMHSANTPDGTQALLARKLRVCERLQRKCLSRLPVLYFHSFTDLLSSPDSYAIVQCVSECRAMTTDLALRLKYTFKELQSVPHVPLGFISVVRASNNNRLIINLVTKIRESDRASLQDLRVTLVALSDFLVKKEIANIAIPLLGCGPRELRWADVQRVIREELKFCGSNINVYHLGDIPVLD